MVCLLVTSTASRDGLGADTNSGWGTATLVEVDDSGDGYDSWVAVDDSGNAIAVWVLSASIWSNRYVDGMGWGVPTLVETDGSAAYAPQVAIDESGNATAIWSQAHNFKTSVWSNRYVVGTGWGTAEVIETYDAGHAESPQLAVDGSGNAIAMWHQWDSSDAYVTVWCNRLVVGTGWGTAELVETIDAVNAMGPQVSVNSSGDATAVWHQWNGSQLSVWSNRYVVGVGWGVPTLVGDGDTGFTEGAQVAVDSAGNAIAVWRKHDGTRYNVWSNRYVVDTGWGTTAELIETNDAGDVLYPQVAVDSAGNAIAVWQQHDGVCESVYSNRYVVGTGWGTTAELIETENWGDARDPQVAMDDSGNAIAVWQQYDSIRESVYSNRYVADIGWGDAELIETENWGDAREPQMAMDDSGNATAVWRQWDGTRYNIWSNRYVVPDTTPPLLSLDSPSNGLTTEASVVMVSGTTEPGVDFAVNGMMVAVEPDGSFSCLIALVEGVNTIAATATDASGNSATVSVSVTYVNPVHELEEELEDTKDELVDVRDELNTTQDDLDAIEEELDAAKDELNATQDELDAVEGELDATKDELNTTQADLDTVEDELSATQDDLEAAEEELSSTSDDLNAVKSQNTLLMAVLALFAILAVVMTVMFLTVRKKLAELSGKPVDEETPPPPQS